MLYDIYLIGTGATGSNLIGNLAQYAISEKKIKKIILIDGDVVESKNYRNQKFTSKDIYKNKAMVLSQRYRKLGIDINYVDSYITDKKMLTNIIINNQRFNATPLIISCIDNNNGRIILDQVFRDDKIPDIIYFDTGNGDEKERNGQLVIGAKTKGEIIAPPVCDYFPQILLGDKQQEADRNLSCSAQLVEKPQCLTTNVMSATTVFLNLVNLITYNKIVGKFFTFTAEDVGLKKIK